MLRRGIVALMIAVMSVGAVQAEDAAKSNRLLDFLFGSPNGRPTALSTSRKDRTSTTKGGIAHAVVADAEKQVPEVRQVSGGPKKPLLQPAEQVPQPTPVQVAVAPVSQTAGTATLSHPGYPMAEPQLAQGMPIVVAGPQGVPMQFVSAAATHEKVPYVYSDSTIGAGGGNPAGALYPSPTPGIPRYVGGTMIPTHAFHPHELMYPHRYKGMYGPFYHKVHGSWILTPFGVWSKENWKLQGTTVDVKYKSHISPFALFHPPVLR